MNQNERIAKIWRQTDIPVVYRRGKGHQLLVKLPFSKENRVWLKYNKSRDPYWNTEKKHWEIPMSWFNEIVKKSLTRWGKVYIIQPYRQQEKCAPACWNAQGHECQCSCMGANHGSKYGGNGWYVVSETFATRWKDTSELACRLLTRS